MSSSFTEDRGPAQYFHGREEIIDTFNSALRFYQSKNRGTTFLIQGAPGAGKTALLDVLVHQAKPKGWTVVEIAVEDLYTPASMAQSLGTTYTIDKEYALQVGVQFLGGGLVGRVAGHASSREILRHLTPETGLILVLDEAQHLCNLLNPPDVKISTTSTLNAIHNGKLGKPVMLLAAGLGTTSSAFKSLGISRFMRKCRVPLGCLSQESTCAVIRDFLIEESGCEPPPRWIEAIAECTHGWPQHIISYADPAADYLASHRVLRDEGLQSVLQQGRAEQLEYYDERAEGIDEDHRRAFARALMDVPLGETTTRPPIMSSLKLSGLTQKEADDLFIRALDQGIIDQRKRGRYGIPIPSLQNWLTDEYVTDKSQDIPQKSKQLPAKPEQLLLPPKKDDQPSVKIQKRNNEDNHEGRGRFSMG